MVEMDEGGFELSLGEAKLGLRFRVNYTRFTCCSQNGENLMRLIIQIKFHPALNWKHKKIPFLFFEFVDLLQNFKVRLDSDLEIGIQSTCRHLVFKIVWLQK